MRSDLHTMEKIDQYLTGKLTGSELNQFKSELASNPELQNLVSDQQLFIQTVNRKALLAEIQAVAGVGGAPWYANPWVAISGGIIVTGIVAGSIYYNADQPENIQNAVELMMPVQSDSLAEEVINYNELAYTDSTTEAIITTSENDQIKITTGHNKIINRDAEVCDDGSDIISDKEYNSSGTTDKPKTDNQVDEKINKNRNRIASYPKGDLAMNQFVDKYMRFPGTAAAKKLSGNVRVKFLVTESGERTEIDAECFAMRDENDKPLTNTQFIFNQKIAHLFENESARIVRIMPLWSPATDSGGNPMLTAVEIYFNFSLKEGISVYRLDD